LSVAVGNGSGPFLDEHSVLSFVPGTLARQDADPLAEGLHGLTGSRRRRGFINTADTVIDWRGQAVSAVAHLGVLTADLSSCADRSRRGVAGQARRNSFSTLGS
jgi:hypothetical protein